jgi:hypothetical protein
LIIYDKKNDYTDEVKSMFRPWKALAHGIDDRKRMTDDRKQMTDDGGQKTDSAASF